MDVAQGHDVDDALAALLEFIGPRPLVGYYLDFDMAVLNRHLRPRLGIPLPNPVIDISGLYFDRRVGRIPQRPVNLCFDHILRDCSFRYSVDITLSTTPSCYAKLHHIQRL